MTFPNRRLTIGLVMMLTLGAGGPLLAQRISPSPSPSVTPTIEQRFEQRYEQPTTRNRAAEREMHEMEERLRDRVQWSRPVIRIGQAFELKAEDTVHHVRGVFSDFVIDGHVTGDVVAILGDVRLGERAVIDGSLVVVGGSVTAAKGAKVGDDFTLVGGSLDAASDFAPGGEYVVIGTPAVGRGLRAFVPWVTRGLLYGRVIVPDLSWVWAVVGIALFIGVVLNLFFNRAVASCADTVARRPLSSFLMGLLVLTLMPILLTILAATVIGLVVVPFARRGLLRRHPDRTHCGVARDWPHGAARIRSKQPPRRPQVAADWRRRAGAGLHDSGHRAVVLHVRRIIRARLGDDDRVRFVAARAPGGPTQAIVDAAPSAVFVRARAAADGAAAGGHSAGRSGVFQRGTRLC
jgi:hypothetical protein